MFSKVLQRGVSMPQSIKNELEGTSDMLGHEREQS